ncbi:MAG: hypothetical protein H6Q89_4851, partial [Myxococcaceae bacterium]|nr:hypothetical protein [Myxococcaceae bacterium]
GEVGGRRVLVREAAFGVSLRDLARGEPGLQPAVAVWCALELCAAIAQWAAAQAICRLDERQLKVGWDGALFVPTLELEPAGLPVRTARPPSVDGPSAVFRICAVLAFALTGRSAFRQDTGALEPLPSGRGMLPAGLAALVEQNLDPSPAARLAGIAELRAQLEPFGAPPPDARAALAERACSRFAQRHACDLARLASVGLWTPPALAAPPADADGWRVLGDQLQSQGDPRGLLIALHAERDAAVDPAEVARLEQEAQRLIDRHGALVPPVYPRAASFGWRFGFVRSAQLIRTGSRYLVPLLLAHPSLQFLEELSFTTGGTGDAEQRVKDLCERRPRTLKVLKMPGLTAEHRAALQRAMPWLERVELARVNEPPGFFRRLLRRLR